MEQHKNILTLPGAIIIAGALMAVAVIYKTAPSRGGSEVQAEKVHVDAVLADGGHILPLATEKNMLDKLQKDGVIDGSKLPQVTELNLLWAFGLANKNQILDSGTISDLRYGGPLNMASVGGWTVSDGSPADHMSKHGYTVLTADRQALVEKISRGIYRPCCNNSTYFPDCNHGMAMLGLLEYLAASGATEDQMWNAAMIANVSWFPDQYQAIGMYLKQNGKDIADMTPKEILGSEYSSATGFSKIASQVSLPKSQSGGGCGVDSGRTAAPARSSGGCGI